MASSDEDIEQTESEWQDWNSEDAGEEGAVSLFDATRWPDAEAALDHDAAAHGFDLRSFRKQVNLLLFGPPPMSSRAFIYHGNVMMGGGACRCHCRITTSSAASTTYAAQLLRARTQGMPSKQLLLTTARSDHGQATTSCDRSLKTMRFCSSTTTILQRRCAHSALHLRSPMRKDLACMRPAPGADGSDWVYHRDTASGGAAGPSAIGVADRADDVDRLRAENAHLREMLRQLAAADISSELVAAARVCIASARCCRLCCPAHRPR